MTEADSRSEWRRPSPWSIFHFAARAIVQNLQAAFFFAPATYGVSRSDFAQFTWTIPAGIIVLVLATSILRYFFFWYRVLDDSVQIRRGALFKKQLNLSFERIQNISLEHPFYFRPFGLVSLKMGCAPGTKGWPVNRS
jgi:putative membrane protein